MYSYNMTNAETALVVGGGIAGTVAAVALQKAGLAPVICEAFDARADGVGAFLTLAPNGVRALRALELDAPVLAAGFATPRFSVALGDGRVIGEMSAGADESASTTTIRRGDLYRALRRQAEGRGIRIEYGKRLRDARRVGAHVVARFEDGTERQVDLLVGADGLHSRLRSVLDPAAPRPQYLGLLNTGGFARRVDISAAQGTVHFIFGKRCFFGWTQHPNGEVWWFANPGQPEEPAAGARIAPSAWRSHLLDLVSADASPARAIVEATESIIGPWPTHDLPNVPVWHRDRMIVIGDAAHAASPSSGQGASMAIEDALVLARCLRDTSDVDTALATYERLRRRRVERVVKQGRRNGSGKTPGRFGRVVRDLLMRAFFPLVMKGDPMAWIHDHRIDWETPATA
jgi:2-polyprenyl-6-methoxyphenol hydroxylase-like FAD-dependent oxidoreductase